MFNYERSRLRSRQHSSFVYFSFYDSLYEQSQSFFHVLELYLHLFTRQQLHKRLSKY